jgi:hypothetical protein
MAAIEKMNLAIVADFKARTAHRSGAGDKIGRTRPLWRGLGFRATFLLGLVVLDLPA